MFLIVLLRIGSKEPVLEVGKEFMGKDLDWSSLSSNHSHVNCCTNTTSNRDRMEKFEIYDSTACNISFGRVWVRW